MGIGYSEQQSFTTKNGLPIVTTDSATSTATSIAIGGNVTDNGGYAVTARGICYSSTNSEPTIADAFIAGGKGNGEFSVSVTGLSASMTYYLRAYATNENGTSYGEAKEVVTKDGNASAVVGAISNITALSASASVTVTDAGGATLQSCGICWSINPNPTTSDNTKAASGMQLNTSYPCNLTELQPNTTYYVRAYATTDITTTYGQQVTFTTVTGLPVLTTTEVTATSTTINARGDITSDGGYNITARGFCYSTTTSNPTLSDEFTTAGIGMGSFSSVISGVPASTTYYVCAYATNSIGTGYSDVVAVTTGNGLPVVTTTAITKNGSTFLSGGYVSDDGGYAVTERGICYGNFPHPDLSATYSHTSDGAGTGYYTSTISSISGVIYLRAYATNANGTSYGEEISIDLDYLSLPTFVYNGHTYRVAPNAPNTMLWNEANDYCIGLELYGYSDWRLPTKEELYQMYVRREDIGGFITGGSSTDYICPYRYWSGSTTNGGCHYYVSFKEAAIGSVCTNSFSYSIRPIRIEE